MGTVRMTKILDKNRILVVQNKIVIPQGGLLEFTDYRGFVIGKLDDKGKFLLKQGVGKI